MQTFNAGKPMFFPCTCLHVSHYYPLPFAVLQPVLMSTGHTPMYTSAVSTLVRAQWCIPPWKSAVSPSVIPIWFRVPIYRLGWNCHRSNCGLLHQSVQSSSFSFFICDGKVEGHCGISVLVLIVIQIPVSFILCEYSWAWIHMSPKVVKGCV